MIAKLLFPTLLLFGLAASGLFSGRATASFPTNDNGYVIDTLATGLTVPWDIVFLPNGSLLFTERNGKVHLYRDSRLKPEPVLVVADAEVRGKMGVLGMCLHPQFSKNKFVYLAYNYRRENAALLKVVRYRFVSDSLVEPFVILDGISASFNHTGCRLAFGPDTKLYITTGDADRPILAQDLKSLNGKILRVNDDGSIPADNPFAGNDTARKEIWTYGHRNTQGLAFEPRSKQLFNSEHGPTGGDEINMIRKGQNYGWPVIHHKDEKAGMNPPVLEFTPSVGPSAVVFYAADAFPLLKGKMLPACLRGEKIVQFQLNGTTIVAEENLLEKTYGRIRALAVGPGGFLYFSTSQSDPPESRLGAGSDMILRMRPSTVKMVSGSRSVKKQEATAKEATGKKTPAILYHQLCASCHGENREGTDRGQSLRDQRWLYGSKRINIIQSISAGIADRGMPAWQGALSKKEIDGLADYILASAMKKR